MPKKHSIIMEREGAIFAILSVMAVMIAMWFLAGVMLSMGIEEVDYVLLDELGNDVQVRQYDNLTVVSILSDDTSSAFSALARYISGNNEQKVRIDMTAPVISYNKGNAVNMSFVLPEEYNSGDVPVPQNTNINVERLSSRKVATMTFSGYVSDSIYEEHREELSQILDEYDIKTKGEYFLMRYNPPWVPPTLMRNEVAIEVE